MKVFVQHPESHYYLNAEGGWVRSVAKARSFESSVKAIRFCALRAVRPFQIVLQFENAEWDAAVVEKESRRADMQVRVCNQLPQDGASSNICKVLIADDSEDDRILLKRLLRNHQQFQIVAEIRDGEKVIDYLSGRGMFGDRGKYPFPDLMFLDLKMPRTTGYEVLEWLQTQGFENLNVVVLSGSNLPEDVVRSYELGADAFETKTALEPGQNEFMSRMEALLCSRGAAGPGKDQEAG